MKGSVSNIFEPVSAWRELVLIDNGEKIPIFEHHISGLSPRTSYEIEITARNEFGWSKSNEQFVFTTSGSKYISQCFDITSRDSASQ